MISNFKYEPDINNIISIGYNTSKITLNTLTQMNDLLEKQRFIQN